MTPARLIETLSASGGHLSVSQGTLKIDAPAGVLTAELKHHLVTYKPELLRLLTQKTCEKCATPMLAIEPGYHSCPACFFQLVEAHSGFWTSGLSQREEAA